MLGVFILDSFSLGQKIMPRVTVPYEREVAMDKTMDNMKSKIKSSKRELSLQSTLE